jgi:glycosyltransferase involved in cell wall biosynthesis/O-antigen/teichoic acid export membrane protein
MALRLRMARRERVWPRLRRRVTREIAVVTAAFVCLNASTYVFHVIVSRILGPSDYGALAALLATALVLSVPFGVIQTIAAQRSATLAPEEVDETVAGFARTLLPIASMGFAATLLLAPLVDQLLHVGLVPATLLAPYVFISLLLSVVLGALQGRLRFVAFAAIALVSAGSRLACGVLLASAGTGVAGAMLASDLAQLVALVLGLRLLGIPSEVWRAGRRSLAHFSGRVATPIVVLSSFWVLAELDIMLAQHYLPGVSSGQYAAAALVGRAILFVGSAVALVAFPRLTIMRDRPEEARQTLSLASRALAIAVIGVGVFVVLLRSPILTVAFGHRYAPAASLVPMLAVAGGALAFANLLAYVHIALRTRAYLLLLSGATLELAGVAVFHGSGAQIALVATVVNCAIAAALLEMAKRSLQVRVATGFDAAAAALRATGAPEVQLSVVLPCHNAGHGLRDVLNGLVQELRGSVDSFEIVVVSDGSTDGTVATASELREHGVRIVEYSQRVGKGHALRMGLADARGKYVAFMDGDGDIWPEAIRPFLALMELYAPDIVLGSKRHPLSDVHYPPLRRVLSWGYHTLVSVVFRVAVRDTQTGLKLLRREVVTAVLPRLVEKRYAFDLELLVAARRLGFRRVFEAPVRIDYRFSSQINIGGTARILTDTLAIAYRHYLLDLYRDERLRPSRTRPALRSDGRLRILIINWRDIRNPEAGGAEVVTHEVGRRWVAAGHDVSLLTSRFAGAPAVETIDGVYVRRIGRLRHGTFHLRVQAQLARLRGFDVVVDEINTIGFLTPLWSRRLPPIVALIHQLAEDVWRAELPRPLAALGRGVERLLLEPYRDVAVATVSRSTSADLARLGFRHVTVIANGRDEPPPMELEKAQEPTFVFVGRLAANKRPEHAVEAFRLIRSRRADARLWVIGQGPLERQLRATLPPGAELLGHVSRHELYERVSRAHCLLVPSVREGWGLVVIEANSVGTPAVGYDVPGIRDSIRDGLTGALVPTGDPAALADAALRLLADPDRYDSFLRNATRWGRSFGWDETAAQLLDLIHAEIGAPAGVRPDAIAQRSGQQSATAALTAV